jgi:hypothetical protein
MDFVISFVIPALVAIVINDFLTHKIVKTEVHEMIYLMVKIMAFIMLIIAISFIKNRMIYQIFGSFFAGLFVTFPRFKKKDKTTGQ